MDDVFRIEISTPFDVGRVNCYGLTGDGLALVDPGPATTSAYDDLVAGLAGEGHHVDDVDRVLVTHPHMDHFGLASRVVGESGATAVAHANAAPRMADPRGLFEREQAFFEPFLQAMGMPKQEAKTAVTLPESYTGYQEPLDVDRELADGDELGGLDLVAVHTPGHAPGSMCFVRESAGVAFTGDHVLADISPNPILTVAPGADDERTRSLPTYLDSLERIQAVDADVGYAGHGEEIPDLAARAGEIVDHHEQRKERIADLVGQLQPVTAYEVMTELFADLPATEVFAGMSEVVGHLDLLEDEGRVGQAESRGSRRYTLRG